MEFPTTISEDKDIESAATSGVTNPMTASGTAIVLYNIERPKFSFTALKVRLESL